MNAQLLSPPVIKSKKIKKTLANIAVSIQNTDTLDLISYEGCNYIQICVVGCGGLNE
jgi:hypothetical protein